MVSRLFRHLWCGHWSVTRAFPSFEKIEAAIAAAESGHSAEIRFVVEPCLDPWEILRGLSGRERAIAVFSQERIWDTEHNNGVLLYLLLADRDIEIVADRGAARLIAPAAWEEICREMELSFTKGEFESAVIRGIKRIGELLAVHFPGPGLNELNDKPQMV